MEHRSRLGGCSFLPLAFTRAAGPRSLAFGVHDEVLSRDKGEGGNEEDHWAIWSYREAAGQWRGMGKEPQMGGRLWLEGQGMLSW